MKKIVSVLVGLVFTLGLQAERAPKASLELKSLANPEIWQAGSEKTLVWQADGIRAVNVVLLRDGVAVEVLAQNTPCGDGVNTAQFAVPDLGPGQYSICAEDADNPLVSSASEGYYVLKGRGKSPAVVRAFKRRAVGLMDMPPPVVFPVVVSSGPYQVGSPASFAVYGGNAISALPLGLNTYGTSGTPGYYTVDTSLVRGHFLVISPSWGIVGFWDNSFGWPVPYDQEKGRQYNAGFHIASEAPFSLASGTYFLESDPDPDGLISKVVSLALENYGPYAVGLWYGPDGVLGGGDDVLRTSGAGTGLVNELTFVGSGKCRFALAASDEASLEDARTYAVSWVSFAYMFAPEWGPMLMGKTVLKTQPTAARLGSFSALRGQLSGQVEITWLALVEVQTLGYRVYRSVDGGQFDSVGGLTPATGWSGRPQTYGLVDRLPANASATYALVEIDLSGQEYPLATAQVGPVAVSLKVGRGGVSHLRRMAPQPE